MFKYIFIILLQDFVETTSHTLAKGFQKYDIHMITCDDDVFSTWLEIIQKYVEGRLPNTRGEVVQPEDIGNHAKAKVEQIKQAPNTLQLNTTFLCCLLGLEPHEVRKLQRIVLDGNVWMRCGKDVPHHIDLDEACKKLKGDTCLK